jgi:hypothetical protein
VLVQSNRRALIVFCVAVLAASLSVPATYVVGDSLDLKLDPDLTFDLSAYNTTVGYTTNLLCSSFFWDAVNSTSVTFTDARMLNGAVIPSLEISTFNGNVSLVVLGLGETDFNLNDFGSNATISLIGYDAEPTAIKVDGSNFKSYSYNEVTDNLSFQTDGSLIQIYHTSVFTAEDALAVAVALIILVFGVCIALILVKKKNE